jgi:hypothetical protein
MSKPSEDVSEYALFATKLESFVAFHSISQDSTPVKRIRKRKTKSERKRRKKERKKERKRERERERETCAGKSL